MAGFDVVSIASNAEGCVDLDALRAAVAGGADEVYLGGRMANARIFFVKP